MTVEPVKVLAFDVFGTVVDVCGSLSRALSEYGPSWARRDSKISPRRPSSTWRNKHFPGRLRRP